MIVVPYNTDAPIYYGPWATIGLIVVNSLVFVGEVVALQSDRIDLVAPYALSFGDGMHPVQWLTSFFLHLGPLHLAGNMLFLWAFGLVVEGKLGWWRFLGLYLAIGMVTSALLQGATLEMEGGSAAGASTAIFGLLAVALVWAPRNDFVCWYYIGWRWTGIGEVSILTFALVYLGLQVLGAVLAGFDVSSEALHLAGALVGFAAGVLLLKLDWVDCEHWDLFALIGGRLGQPPGLSERQQQLLDIKQRDFKSAQLADAPRHIARLLDEGNSLGALALARKMAVLHDAWELPEALEQRLLKGLYDQRQWPEFLKLAQRHVTRSPNQAARVRLLVAQVLIRELGRPAKALQVLSRVDAGVLPEAHRAALTKLQATAQRMVDEGDLEIDHGEEW